MNEIRATVRKIIALREAGYVERAHAIPHVGSYNNAQHSWNVATLIAVLHPEPSKNLILAALWHDVHERWTGDIPAPMKWVNGDTLRNELRRVAYEIEKGLGIHNVFDPLSDDDKLWLKACDMLEFWLWSHEQVKMGNYNAFEGMENAYNWFVQNRNVLPGEVTDFLNNYQWKRLSDSDGWKIK